MDRGAIKELVGRTAAERLVKSGMKIGLGTGSTALPVVRRVAELLQEGAIRDIRAVATSFQTAMECERLGIPLFTLNSAEIGGRLDLTIDGADEVDGQNYLVKGGGAALLLEKIVAYASSSYAIVVDETKLVERLALAFPLPVELIPAARVPVTLALEEMGGEPILREGLRKAGPVITEEGNLILDVRFPGPIDPAYLEDEINRIPGVVENGFFTRLPPQVFTPIGGSNGRIVLR
jgi:ribose 5-phosphate isomerase A